MHVCERLLARGDEVVGVDNLNDYYDVALKEARLARLLVLAGFRFGSTSPTVPAWRGSSPTKSRAAGRSSAQAGVRYSLQNPQAYADSNLVGFLNILEGCRHGGVEHLAYASSSSVRREREGPFSDPTTSTGRSACTRRRRRPTN